LNGGSVARKSNGIARGAEIAFRMCAEELEGKHIYVLCGEECVCWIGEVQGKWIKRARALRRVHGKKEKVL